MIIKKAKTISCKKCGHYLKEISPTLYGCDSCKKPIDLYDKKYKNNLNMKNGNNKKKP